MWGLKVPFDDKYLWVTEGYPSNISEPKPLLFDTKEEAEGVKDVWGPFTLVKEYTYEESKVGNK